MILISEKSRRRPLFDRVPERHGRKYTEPVAMSMGIAAAPPASLVENDYGRDVYNGELGVVSSIDREDSASSPISMAAKSPTALASSTRAESGGPTSRASQ